MCWIYAKLFHSFSAFICQKIRYALTVFTKCFTCFELNLSIPQPTSADICEHKTLMLRAGRGSL